MSTQDHDEAFAEFVRRFPTVDAYMAFHQAAGHICCGCIHQPTPLPCCNPGHDEAEWLRLYFERITSEADR